ncbi:MAG: ATP-binding protein [Anaerolineae bacterium]|nr:ATP-binding protein [Anaerolineae bacterium]
MQVDLTQTQTPVCPHCGGLGYVTRDVPIDHPDFGKAFPCICQAENRKSRHIARLRSIGNMEAYAQFTFDRFQIDHTRLAQDERYYAQIFPDMDELRRGSLDEVHKAQINAAAELAFRYANEEFEITPWLLLKGSYGTGKTHLAASIANYRIDNGEPVLFVTVPDLLDHLRSTYGPSSEIAYDDMFDQVREAPMLILDDLGAESPTAWALEKLYQIFGYRHVKRLPTVITTNADPEVFDARIRSRLLDQSLTQISELNVPDRRAPMQTWGEMDLTRLDRHEGKTFEAFDPRTDEDLKEDDLKRLQRTLQLCRSFVDMPRGWLVITGQPGAGKTHLAAAIAYECNQRGRQTLFVTASDLLNHLRATFAPGSVVRYDKRMEEIKKAEILILDDLLIESRSISAWARDKLYEILLFRYDYDLPTVITTAQPLQDMDLRLRSRIVNQDRSTVEAITVPEYRGKASKTRRAAPPKRN